MARLDKLVQTFKALAGNPYVLYREERPVSETRKTAPVRKLTPEEDAIVREQRRTVFDNDQAMQNMFKNDFDSYCEALDDPDIMIRRMNERVTEIDRSIAERESDESWSKKTDPSGSAWQASGIERNLIIDIEDLEDSDDESFELWEPSFEKDPLYQKTYQWALRVHECAHQEYDKAGRKDIDLFRAAINATMVPAKIAYASEEQDYAAREAPAGFTDNDFEKAETETSLRGYQLAATFLQRVRESLRSLAAKQFEPVDAWREFAFGADAIALELYTRIMRLKQRLNQPPK